MMTSPENAATAPSVKIPGPFFTSAPKPLTAVVSVRLPRGSLTRIDPLPEPRLIVRFDEKVPPVYSSVPPSRVIAPVPNEPATPLFDKSPPLIVPPPVTFTSPLKSLLSLVSVSFPFPILPVPQVPRCGLFR